MNVEKRLRSVVAESLKRSEQFALFIDKIELILIFFALNQRLPSFNGTQMQLDEYLRSPVRIEQRKDVGKYQQIFEDIEGNDYESISSSGLCLVFPIVDSSFCRLLLHATCQYHGMKCKSVEVTTSSCKSSELGNSTHTDNASKQRNKDVVCSLYSSKRFIPHGIKLRSVLFSNE